MYPSRYMTINEKSPYPIKRRVKGRRSDGENEPAITLLPPDPYMGLGSPDLSFLPSPRVYRTVPPKSARNREASSFVILGDTSYSPVQSKPGSPSGRVSPFRGHGFKSPSTTRPNSRAASPGSSPKKGVLVGQSPERSTHRRIPLEQRKDFNRYIGHPPKSPIGGKKSLMMEVQKPCGEDVTEKGIAQFNVTAEKSAQSEEKVANDFESQNVCDSVEPEKIPPVVTPKHSPKKEVANEIEPTTLEKYEEPEVEESSNLPEDLDMIIKKIEREKVLNEEAEKLMPQEFYRNEFSNRSCSMTPTSKTKPKPEKNETKIQKREKTPKIISKPPVPPRKIGLKMSLRVGEETDAKSKNGRGTARAKSGASDKDRLGSNNKNKTECPGTRGTHRTQQNDSAKIVDKRDTTTGMTRTGIVGGGISRLEDKGLNGAKKTEEIFLKDPKPDMMETDDKKFQNSSKLVPCYQPDKCHIAPPTMASPSSIITPSMSTPPTSGNLAFSSTTKNSQSISAAPTTVTSCSLSSVSSTVVLSGNLARKENAKQPIVPGQQVDADANASAAITTKKNPDSIEANGTVIGSQNKAPVDMVKAGNKDLKKEKMSEEIASATGVIKAKPDMEVLSPNNLRDSPPRMPPANVAWEDQRMPNGNVPTRAPTQGKFRRFLSAICKLLGCFFCCRCFLSPCCKGDDDSGGGRKCCSCCGQNPFKCLGCKCKKPKCCEGNRCCGGKKKAKVKSTSCCAKPICSCANCCDRVKARCLVFREKINSFCRCLFCLNLICCQNLLKKCKCCHRLKCCQSNGCCSCCNPYAKSDPKLIKKSSRASTNSKGNNQLDPVLVEHTSTMKAAIPVLPTCLAVFCLICNIFVPGLGTIFSGILCLCFGKPRFSTLDSPKNRFKSFIINIIIGVAQAFTVVFCLVGWGWSIWWGVIMYKLSRRQKRLKLAEKNQKEAGSSNADQNHVDVEQG